MYLKSVLFATVVLCASQQGVQAQWWMNLPYGNENFNYLVQYGQNVTLECNDTFLQDGYNFMYWIRSDLKVMMSGDSEMFWTIDGSAGWRVNQSGSDLHVYTLQESQFGFYHCVLNHTDNGETYVVKKAINYKKPYFGDLWPKYRMNTIIACGSAGGFLVLSIIILLVCKFKYDPEDEDEEYSVKDMELEDPEEGTSSSSSGSVASDVKKSGIPTGPQVYANEAFDIEKGLDKESEITEASGSSRSEPETNDPAALPAYTTSGVQGDGHVNVDTTAF